MSGPKLTANMPVSMAADGVLKNSFHGDMLGQMKEAFQPLQ